MRGKRSKQYRKLMQQYSLIFGFREPYQVLVDAQMIQDTDRFKMDLVGGLERALHGKVKPLITQCSIRHLYTLPSIPQPRKDSLIAIARGMERRRCNHHTLDTPLTTLECLSSIIDPKNSKTNKNRYVVASQEEEVRRYCRGIKGVPGVYVKRSVMVMEPMADASVGVKEGLERGKFRIGLRGKGQIAGTKRKRYDSTNEAEIEDAERRSLMENTGQPDKMEALKKRKARGPKGPNPLSIKKPRRRSEDTNAGEQKNKEASQRPLANPDARELNGHDINIVDVIERPTGELEKPSAKRKRKRKHKLTLLTDLGDKDGGPEVSS